MDLTNVHTKMIRADSENKEPLVIKHKHKRHFFVFRMSKHAWLEVKPEVVESLEAIISKSFLSLSTLSLSTGTGIREGFSLRLRY